MKKTALILVFIFLITITGCSGDSAPEQTAAPSAPVVLDMQQIYDSMTTMDAMPEMLPLDQDMQLNFCGIDPADCSQVVVAICADSLRADEIWLIKAVDEAALERIQTLAQTRLTAKAEESVTYSPEQYAIVQKAEMLTSGNYFAMIVSPEVDALAELFRDAAGI